MPVDTSIYGLLKPVRSPLLDLGAMFEQGQRLRGGQLDLREQERAQQEAEAVRQAYTQQYGGGGAAPAGLAGAQPMTPRAPASYGPALTGMLAQYQAEGAPVETEPPPAAGGGGQAGQAPPAGLAGAGPMTPGDRQGQRAFLDRLYTISPKAGREAEKHAYTTQKQQLEQQIARVDYLGRVADGVLESDNPQQAWEVARAMLIEQGMPPGQAPEMYDPNYVKQLSGMGHDAGDRLRLAQAELSRAQAQRERGKAPDYGLGDDMNQIVYAMFGSKIAPGQKPTPGQVAEARAEYYRSDPEQRYRTQRARREEYEADATRGVREEMTGSGRRMSEQEMTGRPRRMSAADVADAMAQTGRSRAEVIAAARENGLTVEDAPDTGTAPSTSPSTAPSAVPSTAPSAAAPAPAAPRRSPAATATAGATATTTAPGEGATTTAPGEGATTATTPGTTTAPASTSGDMTRLRRLEELRDKQEEQVGNVKRKWGTSEAGKTAVSQAEQELTRRNTEIDRLRTRLERQQEQAKERRTPSAEVRDELLAMGVPVEAATASQVAHAQSSIQTRKERTGIEREEQKPLSTADAALLGVPVGTTAADLRQTGRVPPIINERQAAAYDYGSRALQAETIVSGLEATGKYGKPWVDSLEDNLAKIVGGVGAAIGFAQSRGLGGGGAGAGAGAAAGTMAEPVLNALRSSADQEYLQGKIDFISAVLRKESGAAISAGEFSRENKRYFPQPYDSDRVKQQKARARAGVIEGLREAAGRPLREPPPYAPAPSDLYGPEAAGASGSAPAPPVPSWARPAPRGELYP